MIKFNSIRFKISVIFTLVLGIILLIYTAILYSGLRYTLYRDMDHELVVKAQEVSNAINSYLDVLGYGNRAFRFAAQKVVALEGVYPHQEKAAEVEKQWLAIREKLDLKHDYVTLVTTRGEVIVNSPNIDSGLLSLFLKGVAATQGSAVIYRDIDSGNNKLRIVNIPYYYQNKRLYVIQVGVSRNSIHSVLYGMLFTVGLAILGILLATSFLGSVIAQQILKPVKEVTRIARNITHKDLSVKVTAEHVDEEMQFLVDAFNEMILRLNKSFKYIAEFSSNVAHELKTPLTIMRGESELTLMKERDAAEYRQVISVNLEETERLLKIVQDLLLLSRLEYQPEVFHFEQLPLPEFIRDIGEQAKKLASRKNITVGMHSEDLPKTILADKVHLRRLFLNLLSNAVKFTPERGTVDIEVRNDPQWVRVSIIDTGCGISPKDKEKIFDRFFHVDHSGTAGETSSGLGLSIAQSIAKIHRGDILVRSEPGKGSTFTVSLPR